MFAEIFRPPFAKEPQQPGVGRWLQILTNSKARKVVLASFFYLMNTGQIVKGKRKHDFAIIPNEISQSKELTMEEKGMLCFLLSLPENWVLYKKNLYDQMPDGKNAVDRVFKSLQEKGYVLSCRQVDAATNRMVGWTILCMMHLNLAEKRISRYRVFPMSEIPVSRKTSIYIKKQIPTKKQ
jgi:hypothetical protein